LQEETLSRLAPWAKESDGSIMANAGLDLVSFCSGGVSAVIASSARRNLRDTGTREHEHMDGNQIC
jgi:hypothetical protein